MGLGIKRGLSARFRYLLVLMGLACLGTIVFQCFWLYSNYKSTEGRLVGLVERIFFESVRFEQMREMDRLYPNMPSGPRDRDGRLVMRGVPMPDERANGSLEGMPPLPRMRPGRERGGVPPGTMPVPMGPSVGPMPPPFGPFVEVDEVLVKERLLSALAMEGIDLDMQLDTLVNDPQKGFFTPLSMAALTGYQFSSSPVLIAPAKHLFLRISFQEPLGWMFGQLFWPFCASILLMVITVGCLVFMLYTIVRQKKLADMKNDFVNNMTHELRTPMATVMVALDTLGQVKTMDDQSRSSLYIQLAQKATTHLSKLIDGVLEMADWQAKGIRLKPAKVDVDDLLNDLVAEKKLIFEDKLDLYLQTKHGDASQYMDGLHIRNAINNLLDNAVKYAQGKPVIHVYSAMENGVWQLSVSDEGIGMNRRELENIFQPFYRISTGNKHDTKGFGLGLYYVKQVVEGHGGSISVDSKPDQGTTFTLRLPIVFAPNSRE